MRFLAFAKAICMAGLIIGAGLLFFFLPCLLSARTLPLNILLSDITFFSLVGVEEQWASEGEEKRKEYAIGCRNGSTAKDAIPL